MPSEHLVLPPPPKLRSRREKPAAIRRLVRPFLLLLLGIAIGALAAHFVPTSDRRAQIAAELGTPVKSGPWGELYMVPFVIAAPDELIPVRSIESGGTHWVFKNSMPGEVAHFLEAAGVPEDQRTALLAAPIGEARGIDFELTPTPDMVFALPENARQTIYRKLAQFPENRSAFYFIHKDTMRDRFDDSGVAKETLDRFRTLCCEHGEYLVLGGLPALLAKLPDYDEKLRFTKALTRQKTMLVRLRAGKNFNSKGASDYWAKSSWAPDIRAILDGVERIPGGTFMSIVPLLPPLPASEVYFYPVVQSLRPDAAPVIRDCHWTSLNFFRDPAETKPADPASFTRDLAADYFPIAGDPRYGDIVILATPAGEILHSAVFIADEIVFTKNGSTAIFPWMFSTVTDLLKQYSFHAPEGQQLTVRYFRSKGA